MKRMCIPLIFALGLLPAAASTAEVPADLKFSAISVNGTLIPRSRVDKEVDIMVNQTKAFHNQETVSNLAGKISIVSQRLITRELLSQAATKAGITTTPKDVDDAVAREEKRWGDKFDKALAMQSMTKDYLRGQLEEDLRINRYLESRLKTADKTTEVQEREYYEKNKNNYPSQPVPALRYIFISNADGGREQASKDAETCAARLAKGEPFGALAKEVSDDPSAGQNGVIDAKTDTAKPHFEKAAALRPGKSTPLLSDEAGFYLYARDSFAEPLPFDQVREKVMTGLVGSLRTSAINAIIAELLAQAVIEYQP